MTKINQDNKKNITSISNILSIFSFILMIIGYIGIGLIALVMVVVPFITKNFYFEDNAIVFFDERIHYEFTDEEILTISYNGEESSFTLEDMGITKTIEIATNALGKNFTLLIELFLFFGLIETIFYIFIFMTLKNLFKEMSEKKTPFAKNIPMYINRIAYILIGYIVFIFTSTLIYSLLFGASNITIDITSIVIVLVLFFISNIFKYGYELEHKGA